MLNPKDEALKNEQMKLINYLTRNIEFIPNYKQLQEQGILIGSGTAEKTNDILVVRRMKRRGMTWTKAGRHNMVEIRTVWFNHQWDKLWGFQCQN